MENVKYFMAILQTYGIFYDHCVHFVFIWYISPGFGIMYQEKSGNLVPRTIGSQWFSRKNVFLRRSLGRQLDCHNVQDFLPLQLLLSDHFRSPRPALFISGRAEDKVYLQETQFSCRIVSYDSVWPN
jgi:hypothetical protein